MVVRRLLPGCLDGRVVRPKSDHSVVGVACTATLERAQVKGEERSEGAQNEATSPLAREGSHWTLNMS